MQLSQTWDPESTPKEKFSGPSWKTTVKETSKKLWCPTEIDCAALHSIWLNGSFQKMESNSWFSMKEWKDSPTTQNLPKTSFPSSTFSIVKSMEKEKTIKKPKSNIRNKHRKKKPPVNSSKKIRLHMKKKEDLTILRKWFGSCRLTYNWALGCIKNKPKQYKTTDIIWLRKRFINKCNIPSNKQFLLETPKAIRDSSLFDLTEAYKTNFAKRQQNPNHTFCIRFRKKKDPQSITLPRDQIKKWVSKSNKNCSNDDDSGFNMFPTYIKNRILFHTRKNRTIDEPLYDCKLQMDRLGRFYLHIPCHVEACENQASLERHELCSVDPGIRTLYTLYSPTKGVAYKLADGDVSRIFRLCVHIDKLLSKFEKIKKKGHYKKKRKRNKAYRVSILRARNRLRNLVTEVHCKVCLFLVRNFKKIILPHFETSQMVNKKTRKIRRQTVRQMLGWRFYDLKTRLIEKSKLYDCEVILETEEWTSKTCTHCQNVKYNLGGAKTYNCNVCGLKADRDVCGARNIFMKSVVMH